MVRHLILAKMNQTLMIPNEQDIAPAWLSDVEIDSIPNDVGAHNTATIG